MLTYFQRPAFIVAARSSLAPPGATSNRPTRTEQLEQLFSRAALDDFFARRRSRIHAAVAAALAISK
jgi:hypothetical protein